MCIGNGATRAGRTPIELAFAWSRQETAWAGPRGDTRTSVVSWVSLTCARVQSGRPETSLPGAGLVMSEPAEQFLHNDEPTLDDAIERAVLVQQVGDAIAACHPPYVFGVPGDTEATVASHELESVHWVPLRELAAPETATTTRIHFTGFSKVFPSYRLVEEHVWGLTHRILTGFLDLYLADAQPDRHLG